MFVSYHKQDRERAEQAVASLAAHGYSVWWDDRVTPMESWDKTVEREIDQARCVLVLWTKESVESDWVRIEANFAKMAHPRKLVQVRIEDCRIPMNFSMIQYIDAFDTAFDPAADESWARALEWVGLFAGLRPDIATSPPPPPKPRKRKARKAARPLEPVAMEEAAPSPPPPPPAPPLVQRAGPAPQPAMHAFAAPPAPPPPRPRVDYEAALRRAFSGVTSQAERLINTGSYWRRGLVTTAIGCLVGALLFAWCINSGFYAETNTWFYAGAVLLRAAGACALGYVLVATGRLAASQSGILIAAFVVLTIVDTATPTLLASVAPEGTLAFLADMLVLSLLWLLARQLGAFRAAGANWRWPIAASGACAIYALLYGVALANGAAPSMFDVGEQVLVSSVYVFLECCVLLALFAPMRAGERQKADNFR